jgi:hypothetical protein
MGSRESEVKIRTGRRDVDGELRLSVFMKDILALTLEGHDERAPTFLLTLEQARRLQDALAELISLAEQTSGEEKSKSEAWEGKDRRRLAS